MKLITFLCICVLSVKGQEAPDRVLGGLQDRALADQALRLRTDDRISLYDGLARSKPDNLHYKVLLAGAYIQKMRETTDFSYVARASGILDEAIARDGANYEALRLRTEVALERHDFKRAADLSLQLTRIAESDPWNYGTLGDAYIELGDYDKAADAYQKMINMRPDLSSYNRAAHYRFLMNDMKGAVEIMKRAIEAGSPAAENVAWCWVELGNYYLKSEQARDAEAAFGAALRTFPNYHPAWGGIGKARLAAGKNESAVEAFLRAQGIVPLPEYAAGLYDAYSRMGKKAEAAKQLATLDAIDALGRANGEKANRSLALIFADHDYRLGRALELARAELEFRRDVYTYDALAWALYKNGRLEEAAKAMESAVRFHTPEPMFALHARKIQDALAARGTR